MITATVLSALFSQCAPDVNPITLNAIVKVESSGKPYVVANVTDETSHYFDSKDKAISFIDGLSDKNKRFSAGLMQIYSGNFKAYGLTNESVFDHCTNIKVGAEILKKCYSTALKDTNDSQVALRKAMSCYYSGNFTRGFKKESDGKSYVQRIESRIEDIFDVPEMKLGKDPQIKKPDYSNQDNQKSNWDVFGDY